MFEYPDTVGETRHAFLADLYDDEMATVVGYMQGRRYRAGEYAIRQGEVDRTVYAVTSGSFDLITPGAPQSGLSVDPLIVGDIFGENAFFDSLPRTADVVAREASEALLLTPSGFERLRLNEPRLAVLVIIDVGRALSFRLRHLEAASGRR